MYSIGIETTNGRQDVVINKNLTINNIIASLELDLNNGEVLTYKGRTLKGGGKIKDALENHSIVMINRPQST